MIRQKGQTLLEILLAFSVLVLILSAAILGITTSLSNAQYTKNQNLANSYAQEGMTIVRQIRDSDWVKFSSYITNATYCLPANSTDLVAGSFPPSPCISYPVGGVFLREIIIEQNSSNCSAGNPPTPTPTPTSTPKGGKVTIRVLWTDSKCPVGNTYCNKVELVTCFSNIDQKITP